jgi:hypothetical protein
METDPKQPKPIDENTRNMDSFKLGADKSRFYADVLKYIIRKLLPDNAAFLVYDLEKVVYKRLAATESNDSQTNDSLEPQETALTNQIIELITKQHRQPDS